MVLHHAQEPIVGFTAVGGREPERHLGWQQVRVGILAADGQAGSAYNWSGAETAIEIPRVDAYAVNLWAMVGQRDGWMGLLRGR